MPLTSFPGNQERLRELGEPPPLRCLGLPLQGSPETTLREETFVHCTRTGKESVGDKLGAQSVRPSVCLSVCLWEVVLLASPAPPSQKQGPPNSALQPRSGHQQLLRGSSSLKVKTPA